MKMVFEYKEIENAFATGAISLKAFAEVLAENLGKKKARKVLRKNLEMKLKEDNIAFNERQETLLLVSLLI